MPGPPVLNPRPGMLLAALQTRPFYKHRNAHVLRSGHHLEVDHDLARRALHILDTHGRAKVAVDLRQQGQGIVVVAKAHSFAGAQRVQRAEDGRVAKALGNAARIKEIKRLQT